VILFERAEIATMLAALRFYQREMKEGLYPYTNDNPHYWMLEIATDGGTLSSLDAEGIDELIDKIQEFNRE
jgi:sulfite reductase beta subunit-like hemoprotein